MSLTKQFFRYAVPAVISMWVFSIYSMVDGMFVAAGVGPMALAAVNIALPFVNLVLGVSLLFSTGAAAVISIAMGRKETGEARQVMMTTIVALIAAGLAISTLGTVFLEPIALFLGATEGTLVYVKGYLGVILRFSVFHMLSYFLEVMTRTDGFPRVAMTSVIVAGLTNVVLDYVFVMRLGWGVEGAAFATGLAQLGSTLFLIIHFLLKQSQLKFTRFRFRPGLLLRSLPLGAADSVTEFSAGIVVFLFNRRIYQVIGEEALVSYTVIAYISVLVLMTMSGLSQGMLPLVSYQHGRGDREKVSFLLRLAMRSALVCSAAWFAIAELFTGPLVSLFIRKAQEPALFAATVEATRLYAVAFLFIGVNVVLSTWFSAVERPRQAVVISLGRGLVVAALCLWILPAFMGPVGVWLSAAASELVCAGISLALYRLNGRERVGNPALSATK